MATKTFKVALSLDNPRIIQSGINVHSFDKQSIKITIDLTKDSQVYQIPTDAQIKISLLKLSRQEQKIILDVPFTSADSIDWIVPDYLDGYQGTVRVGVYLVSGTENVDLGYFTILSNVSDIDKMADEFVDNVFQGWEQIEADLNELNLTIAQTKLDLADDLTQVDNVIANINAKNTQVNTLHSDFTAGVATKQADVTSKYNAFDTSVTTANQTIDDILGLADDVQQVSAQVAEKVQNFKIKNEITNGDFSRGSVGWILGANWFVSDGKAVSNNASGTYLQGDNAFINLNVDKYYIAFDVSDYVSGTLVFLNAHYNPQQLFNSDGRKSTIITPRVSNLYVYAEELIASVDNLLAINLTSTFGVGNEPAKLEMDELLKVIPNQWWDGELTLTQKQFVTWQLNLIRKNTNAIISLGGTIV